MNGEETKERRKNERVLPILLITSQEDRKTARERGREREGEREWGRGQKLFHLVLVLGAVVLKTIPPPPRVKDH
jgi:hypothetical protein